MEKSYIKEIAYKTGSLIEIRRYKRSVVIGNNCNNRHISGTISAINKEKNRENVLNKKRNGIKRLANTNRTENDIIGTFTFEEFINDETMARKRFYNFIERLKYHHSDANKYIWAMERHRHNFINDELPCIHFHSLFFQWPDISEGELQDLWRQGDVYLSDTKKIINLGAYFSKYVTKDSDHSLIGRTWDYSKNLKKPVKELRAEYSDIPEEDILFASVPRSNDYYGEIQTLYIKS